MSEKVTSLTALTADHYYFIAHGSLHNTSTSVSLSDTTSTWLLASALSPGGAFVVAAQKGGTRVVAYDTALSKKIFDVQLSGGSISSLAVADLNGDGEKDILLSAGSKLFALNRTGSMLDGFPVTLTNGATLTGNLVVGDFTGSGSEQVGSMTDTGSFYVWNSLGKLVSGYPVAVASPGTSSSIALFPTTDGKLGWFVASSNGETRGAKTSATYNSTLERWTQQYGSSLLQAADTMASTSQPLSSEFLPKVRVYNWPNPVYGSTTNIRYYTSENATVHVKIFDLSGRKITELTGTGTAGFDNDLTWDVSGIQSGVYLARVEAVSAKQSAVQIIKIAVVK
jgi:hypothetical protein